MIGATTQRPKVRLPGARRRAGDRRVCREVIVVIMRQTPRTFVERLDFVTSVGYGRRSVITDLGVLRPDPSAVELDPDV